MQMSGEPWLFVHIKNKEWQDSVFPLSSVGNHPTAAGEKNKERRKERK